LTWLATNWVSILSTAIVAVLAWLAANWVGKPIVDARDKCLKALKAAERNAYVGGAARDERIVEARAALNDAVSDLRSISRGQWQVRLYCRLAGYDLETAASVLVTLHNRIGNYGYDDERRKLILDAIYVLLGAHQHLKRDRVDEIKRQLEQDRQTDASSP
jgi:hypothetical protein